MNPDPGLGGVQDESGHGPFTSPADAVPEDAQSLIDRHGKGLRLWIRLSKDSWDMDWTSARKCRYAVGGQRCAPTRLSCADYRGVRPAFERA
jgi:hypothetical protein